MADQEVSILGTFEDRISTPFSKVLKLFTGLDGIAKGLVRTLDPLASKAAAIVATLGGAAVFRESLRAAEQQVQAEARLLQALGGRQKALERIKNTTTELQKTTRQSDEHLLDLAASLLAVGVQADEVDSALNAVINTAAALGKDAGLIVQAISAARRGETGRLGTLVPELKGIVESGGDAAAIIDLLNRRFAGTEEALARTPFGKARVELNLMGETAEQVGNVLNDLRVVALERLRTRLDAVGTALQRPEFRGLLEVGKQLVPVLVDVALGIAAIGSAAGGLRLLTFLLPILSATIPLGTALAGVAASILAIKLASSDAQKDVSLLGQAGAAATDELGKLRDEFGQLLADIANGKLPVTAFFDRIKLQARNVFDFVVGLLKAELEALASNFPTIFIKLLDVAAAALGKLGILIRKTIENAINSAIEAVRAKFPTAADFLGLTGDVQLVSPEAIAAVDANLKRAFAGLKGVLDEVQNDAQERLGPTLDRIAERNAEFEASLAEQRKEREHTVALAGQDLTATQQKLDALREQVDANATLADQARSGQLAQEGSLSQLQAELATKEEIVQADRDRFLLLLGQRADLLARQEQEALTLELLQEQLEVEGELAESSRELAESEKARAEVAAEVARVQQEAADKILQQLTEQRQQLDSTLQAIGNRREAGQITQGESLQQTAAAVDAFKLKLTEARAELDRLAAGLSPEQAETLRAQLADLQQGLDPEKPRGFFEGVVDGAISAGAALDDLGAVGAQVGETLANNLADGIVNVFVKGTQTFKEFLGEFLQGIAVMIVRLLVLRAIQATLGGAGSIVGSLFAHEGGLAFAGGGHVPGPRVDRDVVDAKLTPGEFVQPTESVDYYGATVMEAMRRRLIPRETFGAMPSMSVNRKVRRRFAEGGGVSQSLGTPASGGVATATIVANEQALDRLLSGGNAAFLRAVERNSDTIGGMIRKGG